MTCTCGPPYGDHQMYWTPATGDNWAGECDLCHCPCFTDAATPSLFGDDDER